MILDGYIRVSQVAGRSGPSFISPGVQRDAIEGWAKQRGIYLARVFEELDESGGRSDRPLLLETIARVEQGHSDGIIVAYLSRFGRSLLDGLVCIKRITEAGGKFISVKEDFDFSTETGRLMLRVMFSIGEWELDRTRANWEAARARAIARGAWTASTPVGYRRGRDGRLVADPASGPVVTELFRRRAEGASITELRRTLMDRGVPTATGKSYWHYGVTARLLKARVYRGELRHGEFLNLKGHLPLVDEATWQRAQLPSRRLPEPQRKPALLRGILRCAGCQRLLIVGASAVGSSMEQRWYHCSWRGGPPCPAPARVSDERSTAWVEAVFWQELEGARRRRGAAKVIQAEQEVQRREQALLAYRDNERLPLTLGAKKFAAGLDVRACRVEAARVALSRLSGASDAATLPAREELGERWHHMSITERREAIAKVLECVFVGPRHVLPEDRFAACLRGRGPAGMPGFCTRKLEHTRAFDPSTCAPTVTLRTPEPDWDAARLRRELDDLLAGHEQWPPFRFFQERGRAMLYDQVRRLGGCQRWAKALGLRFDPPPHMVRPWSEDRIHAELQAYLATKTQWPSKKTFIADGHGPLREAVRWAGGVERWSDELGVPRRSQLRTLRPRWTYARIKEEVAALAGESGLWPGEREFKDAGLAGLLAAVWKQGLRAQLLDELGLQLRPAARRHRPPWTDAEIRTALERLIMDVGGWPTVRHFENAGLGGLYSTMRKRKTLVGWGRRFGFELRGSGHGARPLP
jgi:DNA invertase Pin-like site-specific DNA recombinase